MTTVDWASLMQQAQTAAAALPVGDYNMLVANCTATSSKNGKPMFKAKLQVEDGPHAGRSMTNNFNLTLDNPVALRIFFRQMNSFGLDSNFFAQNPTYEQIAAMLVGRRARISVTIEKWQGEDQNRISAIGPALGSVPTGVSPVGAVPGVPGVAPMAPQVPATPTVPTVPQAQVPVPTPAQAPAAAIPAPQPVAPVAQPVAEVPQAAAPQAQQPVPLKWVIGADGQPVQVPDMEALAAMQAAATAQPVAAAAPVIGSTETAPPPVPY